MSTKNEILRDWVRKNEFCDLAGAFSAGWDAREPEIDALRKMTRENVLAAVKDRNSLIAERDESQERFEELRDVVYHTANVERDLLRKLVKECEEELVWCESHWGADYGDLIKRIRAALSEEASHE